MMLLALRQPVRFILKVTSWIGALLAFAGALALVTGHGFLPLFPLIVGVGLWYAAITLKVGYDRAILRRVPAGHTLVLPY